MKRLRVTVATLVAATVVLAVGAQPGPTSSSLVGTRRRAVTVRTTRGGTPRLDAIDATSHDGLHRDPAVRSVADGGPSADGARLSVSASIARRGGSTDHASAGFALLPFSRSVGPFGWRSGALTLAVAVLRPVPIRTDTTRGPPTA